MKNPQKTAIARFMAARKRYLQSVPRSFPKYTEGMSTADYISAYARVNSKSTVNLLPFTMQFA
jgi:hypothetical protein